MSLDALAYKGLTSTHSRRKFLKRAGMVGGGIMAMGIVGEGLSFGVAAAQTAGSDVQTLQFAYTLENVAIAAYKLGAGSGLLTPDVVAVATKIAGQHQDHANALKAAIQSVKGEVPAVPTKINFPAFKTQEDVLKFALALESAAVGAYYTSSGKFTNRDLASAAASIVGVEATHVAILSSALKMDPIPTAFVTGTPFDQVQATANSLLGDPPAGQGGGTPTTTTTMPSGAPATGTGGASTSQGPDLTGAGILGLAAAVAGTAFAFTRRRQPVQTTQDQTRDE
jgi:rubrerythrin